jgi:hypothetical protein
MSGSYRSNLTAPNPSGWIHDLAKAELHPDAERLLQLNRNFDPQQLVEESTVNFLAELREQFNECIRLFNSYSDSGAKFNEIKIYNVAQTAADFMMFRNSIKLVVANTAHGVVNVSFAQHVRTNLAIDGHDPTSSTPVSAPVLMGASQDILAQVGPFRDVYWTYLGERVSAEQIAKFYFAEFARVTRDTRRSRSSNAALVEQIRALLEERGLEL